MTDDPANWRRHALRQRRGDRVGGEFVMAFPLQTKAADVVEEVLAAGGIVRCGGGDAEMPAQRRQQAMLDLRLRTAVADRQVGDRLRRIEAQEGPANAAPPRAGRATDGAVTR